MKCLFIATLWPWFVGIICIGTLAGVVWAMAEASDEIKKREQQEAEAVVRKIGEDAVMRYRLQQFELKASEAGE